MASLHLANVKGELRDLYDVAPNAADLSEISDGFGGLSDVDLAVQSGKLLDRCLKIALGHLPAMPRAGFSQRIDRVRKLSLLRNEICNDIKIICDIRNVFAHSLSANSFEEPLISRECQKLTLSKITAKVDILQEMDSNFVDGGRDAWIVRRDGRVINLGVDYIYLVDASNRCGAWISAPCGGIEPRTLFLESSRMAFFFLMVASAPNL